MELLYLIGFFVIIGFIGWLFEVIPQFIDHLRYVQKLKKLEPQLQNIDLDYLSKTTNELKDDYQPLLALLMAKHKFSVAPDNVKTLHDYVREEAEYRRSKRKRPARTGTYRRL